MSWLIRLLLATILMAGMLGAQGTRVVFEANAAAPFPFPADTLTAPDAQQKTGLRMNLPLPDCAAEPSSCQEIGLINELDGFSINPRIQVRFSAPVDVTTLRDGIFFVWLDKLFDDQFGLYPAGHMMRINQVYYDPETHTAYAKPDEHLYQRRRYALVVTSAVRDRQGNPVTADPAFAACVAETAGYCGQVRDAVAMAGPKFAPNQVVAASVFTTQSVTAWLESARDALENAPLGVAPIGMRSVFNMADIEKITMRYHVGVAPAAHAARDLPIHLLNGVGRIAVGTFTAPSFVNERHQIPAIPTGQPVPLPARTERLQFAVYLPATPPPPGGYPVVIAPGNAGGDAMWHSSLYAGTFARYGMATITVNAFAQGWGPEGQMVIQEKNGTRAELPYRGRSVDYNGDLAIGMGEGCALGWEENLPIIHRDCLRQTALDLQQLVRVIKTGLDVDGNGRVDLDPRQIHYHGMSLGGFYGSLFAAISPDVIAAVFDGSLGSIEESRLMLNSSGMLSHRRPSIFNGPNGILAEYVPKYKPVRVFSVPGAAAVHDVIERVEWCSQPGEQAAYMQHLWWSTLPGVPVKPVLLQYGMGDNPLFANLVRNGNLRASTVIYHHQLAQAKFPALFANPHGHTMPDPRPFFPSDPLPHYLIAILAQEQAATFLTSGGRSIYNANYSLTGP
jgi:hypothetical protein